MKKEAKPKIYTRAETISILKEEFKKMGEDVTFYQGYLLGAADDKCIDLPEGWLDWPLETLIEKSAEAFLSAALKLQNGETLPSELMPLPPARLQ